MGPPDGHGLGYRASGVHPGYGKDGNKKISIFIVRYKARTI